MTNVKLPSCMMSWELVLSGSSTPVHVTQARQLDPCQGPSELEKEESLLFSGNTSSQSVTLEVLVVRLTTI